MRDHDKVLAYWPRRLERESKRRMNRIRTEKIPRFQQCEDIEYCGQQRAVRLDSPEFDPAQKMPPNADHPRQKLSERLKTS